MLEPSKNRKLKGGLVAHKQKMRHHYDATKTSMVSAIKHPSSNTMLPMAIAKQFLDKLSAFSININKVIEEYTDQLQAEEITCACTCMSCMDTTDDACYRCANIEILESKYSHYSRKLRHILDEFPSIKAIVALLEENPQGRTDAYNRKHLGEPRSDNDLNDSECRSLIIHPTVTANQTTPLAAQFSLLRSLKLDYHLIIAEEKRQEAIYLQAKWRKDQKIIKEWEKKTIKQIFRFYWDHNEQESQTVINVFDSNCRKLFLIYHPDKVLHNKLIAKKITQALSVMRKEGLSALALCFDAQQERLKTDEKESEALDQKFQYLGEQINALSQRLKAERKKNEQIEITEEQFRENSENTQQCLARTREVLAKSREILARNAPVSTVDTKADPIGSALENEITSQPMQVYVVAPIKTLFSRWLQPRDNADSKGSEIQPPLNYDQGTISTDCSDSGSPSQEAKQSRLSLFRQYTTTSSAIGTNDDDGDNDVSHHPVP